MPVILRLLTLLFLALAVPTVAMAQTGPGGGGPSYPDDGDNGYWDDREDNGGGYDEFNGPIGDVFNRVRRFGFNTPEYIVSGPIAEFDAARAALVAAGATLLRYRDLPFLGLRIAIYDFGGTLDTGTAQDVLDANAPNSHVGLNNLYSLAQGRPRVYAASMVGLADAGSCALGRRLSIGLIDGPVDVNHPALAAANVITESVLTASERAPGADHGTAVAALMVGEDPGGALGGLVRGADLYAISAFTRTGANTDADVERIAAAIDRLLARDVRLINMSFAGPENPVMAEVLELAAAQGAVMIAAAGNDGRELAAYPASHPDVIAVTAVDAAFRRYRAANSGPHIEFAAPGVDLYVAGNGVGGSYASGTSYAAPIVTALAARLGAGGGLSVDALRTRLRNSAVDLGPSGRDAEFGWGLVRGGC
jgi:subtilisin family serine protease